MKKQLFTLLCTAMLLTSCGQTADSGSDKSSTDKTDVQTSLTDSVVSQTETDADTQAGQDDPDTSGYRVRLLYDIHNPDNSWYITDPAVMGYLDDFTQNYLSDCEEITEIGTVKAGPNFADVFFENGSELYIRSVCGNVYNINFDEKYYEIPQDKLDELMDTIRATQPSKASSGNAKKDESNSVSIDLTLSPYNDYDLDQNAEEPVYLSDDLYIYNSLYFSENNEKIDKEDKLNFNLLFNNTTEYDVSGDFFFELEYYSSDDKWYSVPPTDYFFNEMAVIYPKGAYNVNYKLSDINYDFKEGKYRLIRKISIDKYNGDCLVVYYFDL